MSGGREKWVQQGLNLVRQCPMSDINMKPCYGGRNLFALEHFRGCALSIVVYFLGFIRRVRFSQYSILFVFLNRVHCMYRFITKGKYF